MNETKRRTITLRVDAGMFSDMSTLVVCAKVFAAGMAMAEGPARDELVEQFLGDVAAYDDGTIRERVSG